MTTAVLSQEVVEAIRINTAPTAQVSQVVVEVIRKIVPVHNTPMTFINT